MGTFEFSICPRNDFAHETEDCFIPLKVNGSDRYKIRSHRNGIFTMPVTLPRDINCQYCVFRWHWKSGMYSNIIILTLKMVMNLKMSKTCFTMMKFLPSTLIPKHVGPFIDIVINFKKIKFRVFQISILYSQ